MDICFLEVCFSDCIFGNKIILETRNGVAVFMQCFMQSTEHMTLILEFLPGSQHIF